MKRSPYRIAGATLISAALVVGGVSGFQIYENTRSTSTSVEAVPVSTKNQAAIGSPVRLPDTPSSEVPAASPNLSQAPGIGETFGTIFVPRLRDKIWAHPLLNGIEDAQLNVGIGHFPHSVLPGQIGNFSIAGHRATHLEPFAFIDQLQSGDEVIIRTDEGWFVYTLTKDQIVKPEDVWVVDPVPGDLSATPTKALLTIVTCEPRWGSTSRWIWWGELTEVLPLERPPLDIQKYGSDPI